MTIRSTPWKKSFPDGTLERMEELLASGELSGPARERVTCIRLLALGRTDPDVAQVIGRSVNTVYRHKARFLKEGEAALMAAGWGGRRNAVLTEAEEAELVAGFERAARDGELITANAVIAAVLERTGRRVDPTTVYRMLEHQGDRPLSDLRRGTSDFVT